jgi:hypothetical protein
VTLACFLITAAFWVTRLNKVGCPFCRQQTPTASRHCCTHRTPSQIPCAGVAPLPCYDHRATDANLLDTFLNRIRHDLL